MIDYNAYLNMTDKELEKIIVHTKNILHLRKNNLIEAVKKIDIKFLSDYLQDNNFILPDYLLPLVDIVHYTEKNIQFLNLLKKTDQWQNIINEGLPVFFDIIADISLLKKHFEEYRDGIVHHTLQANGFRTISEACFDFLIQEKIIDFNNKEIMNSFFLYANPDVIIHSIKQQYIIFTHEQITSYYLSDFYKFEHQHFNYLEQSYPFLKELNLEQWIQNSYKNHALNKSANHYDNIKKIIKLSEEKITQTFSKLALNPEHLPHFIRAFNNISPEHNHKLFLLVDHIQDKQPALIESLKYNLISPEQPFKPHFKKDIEKALLLLNLTESLSNESTNIVKTVKI